MRTESLLEAYGTEILSFLLVILATVAWRFVTDRRRLRRNRREVSELTATATRLTEQAASSDDSDALRQELSRTRARLTELESTVPFEEEARRSKWASRFNQIGGATIVIAVLVIGGREWLDNEEVVEISTGTGLARLGVVAAAFFLAGQFFRRATVLAREASEFQRGAIAMRVIRDLAEQLDSVPERDGLVRDVYQSHLSRSPTGDRASADAASLPPIAKLIELIAKDRK